jgi:hypothetical protein
MTLPKIDEWIKEVETRPGSAITILKLIAGRLHDLTERNEALLAENLSLQDGSKVEEYRRRIAHLEFELDLLKRRYGLDEAGLTALVAEPAAAALCLLVYNSQGRILRLNLPKELGTLSYHLEGELLGGGEPPSLVCVPDSEEMLLLFTSGRISTCSLENLSALPEESELNFKQGSLPDEPHAGERLACLLPLSWMPMADFFIQASRRGCIKKTLTSIAENIFANHFLGKGAVQKQDQPFNLGLCQKQERFAVVSQEGRLLGMEVDSLSYSTEERIKLDGTDHVIAGFTYRQDELIFCLTQTGKVISKGAAFIEPMKAPISRGQALIPESRLEQGVRFIGAAAIKANDRVAVLDKLGNLNIHLNSDLTAAGSVKTSEALLAFGVIPAPMEKKGLA